MLPNGKNFFRLLALVVLVLCGTISVAQVDDEDGNYGSSIRGDTARIAQAAAKFRQECSPCHVAYPPGMLPTGSWRKIMAGLANHFDTDASLSVAEVEEITGFLEDNSVDYWGAKMESTLRISETNWFLRRHNVYVVPLDIWNSPAVKCAANCPACHRQAENGDFSERSSSLPE